MCCHLLNKTFFVYLIFLLFCKNITGQSATSFVPDSSNQITYQFFFDKLEKRDSILVFYKTEWFANKTIDSSFASLTLENALAHVKRLNKLSCILLDGHSVIFVPYQVTSFTVDPDDKSDVLLIGNQDQKGKFSKATITGTIHDGKTDEPLFGATVSDVKLNISAITDVNGGFSITLPAGDHTLTLTYIGYEGTKRKINLQGNGNVAFDLYEKSVKLNELVITAERAEFNVTGTQMSLLRLNAKTIRELPVTLGERDIIRSMALLPGIQNSGEFGTGFNVRGGSIDQNLILIEDVPLVNSSHLFGLTSTVNADNVSNVTLLKAGIPARYGERSSSVMDIRLVKDIPDKAIIKGGIGLLDSRLGVQVPLWNKNATLLLGGRSSYSNWLLHKIPDYDLRNSSASYYDLNALYMINVGPSDKITLFGYYSSDKFGFNKITNYGYTNLLSSARWTHLYSNRLSWSLLMGYSGYSYHVNELDEINPQSAYQISLQNKYNNLKLHFSWLPNRRHSVDFGINGVLYRISPGKEIPYGEQSIIRPVEVQSEKGLEMAVYASDNFDIFTGLNVEVGIRFVHYMAMGPGYTLVYEPGMPLSAETVSDTLHYSNFRVSYQHNALEPRIALRYTLNGKSSVKCSYNRINQFINLISNNSVMSPIDTWTLSNTNVKPLVSDQYAVGYFRNFAQNTYEISVEAYYKFQQNLSEIKNGALVLLNEHIETDLLYAKGFAYGIEFYARKSSGRLTGWISYTYSRSMLKTSGTFALEQINRNNYYPSNFDKPNNLVVNINYHLSRRWRISGTFTYNTGRPVTLPELKYLANGNQLIYYSDRNKYRLPDYHRLDIAITYDENLRLKKMWKGSWTLSVINVYGRDNAYSVYYAKEDSRMYRSSGIAGMNELYIIGIPMPTLTYNFTF
jgi:hypothetical protein